MSKESEKFKGMEVPGFPITDVGCQDCKSYVVETIGHGHCHKKSPQLSGEIVGQQHIGAWPLVHDDDWCGEFEAKA